MTDRLSALARLVWLVAERASGEPLAERLCRACVEVLDAQGAAITLATSRPERVTVWATDGTSAALEQLQDVLGEGPGQEAFDTNRAVITRIDGGPTARYPVFSDLASAAEGHATIWALPMRTGGGPIGVVTLYRHDGSLARSLDDAQHLADVVTAALADDPEGPVTPEAWSARARVHQATGMVVAELGLPPEDALALLRAHAFAESSSVDAVAAQVLARTYVFPGPGDSTGR